MHRGVSRVPPGSRTPIPGWFGGLLYGAALDGRDRPDLMILTQRVSASGAVAPAEVCPPAAAPSSPVTEVESTSRFRSSVTDPCLDDRHSTSSSLELVSEDDPGPTSLGARLECVLGLQQKDRVPIYAAPSRATSLDGLPPAYLCVGQLDLVRDETIDYASRLLEAGVSTELHVYPGAFHASTCSGPEATISVRARAEYNAALKRGLTAPS